MISHNGKVTWEVRRTNAEPLEPAISPEELADAATWENPGTAETAKELAQVYLDGKLLTGYDVRIDDRRPAAGTIKITGLKIPVTGIIWLTSIK